MSHSKKELSIGIDRLTEKLVPAMLRFNEPQVHKDSHQGVMNITFQFACSQAIQVKLQEINGNLILIDLQVHLRRGRNPTTALEQLLRDRMPQLSRDIFDHLEDGTRIFLTAVLAERPIGQMRRDELFNQIPIDSAFGQVLALVLRSPQVGGLWPEIRSIVHGVSTKVDHSVAA